MVRQTITLIFLLTGQVIFSQVRIQDSSCVCTVNGEKVTAGEFRHHARNLRTIGISAYQAKYGIAYGSDFWSRSFDGNTPMDVLRKNALDTLVQIKISQICARDAGLVSDISYEGFLQAFTVENRRRIEAKRSGELIYGPVQYSEVVYYNYLFTNLEIRLKEYLANTIFKIGEEQVRQEYEKHKVEYGCSGYVNCRSAIRSRLIDHRFSQFMQDKVAVSHVVINKDVYDQIGF